MVFDRTVCMVGINRHYAPAGLRPGRYKCVSQGLAPMFGPELGIWCFVILYKGRLIRCWLQ